MGIIHGGPSFRRSRRDFQACERSRFGMPSLVANLEALPEEIQETAAPELGGGGAHGTFNGFWRATFAADGVARPTTVCVSGASIWHDCDLFARFRELTSTTCVIMMKDEDIKGHLSDDGKSIEWEDGDCWHLAEKRERQHTTAFAEEVPTTKQTMPPALPQQPRGDDQVSRGCAVEFLDAVAAAELAVLRRERKALADALDDGASPNGAVLSERLWRELRWDVDERGEPAHVTLLVACILLQWPQGVELCVQRGADVNATYVGPLRLADGSFAAGADKTVPVLRVALSARGPVQCILVQHILGGRVRCKTVQALRRKARQEMEMVTAQLLDRFDGPFADT